MALSALPRHCKHHVFPSFHGKDVRRGFLSCLLKEFKEKGIDVFIDNDLERSKLIGPKLTEAIRGSLIAILLISRNYASSTWCLNELVEIMKCREEDKQTVEVIFYEVDPSDVKKQKGDFGAVFQKTCAEKSTEEVERWRQALQIVTQIAGYHTSNLMDQPPSFPHYQSRIPNFFHRAPLPLNSNPNFFHRSPPPPLQTPNTYSIPPSPPPIRELSGTLSPLQSLISECQRTLDSLSQNLSLDHSSLLHKDGLVRCPFDPNHLMPPEALVLHSLRCPSTLDLTPLLGSFSSYRNTLELPCEPELNNGDGDLCFSLDDVTDFFYNDCPGAVNFSDLDGKTRRFTLPTVLSVECSELEGSSVLKKSLFV